MDAINNLKEIEKKCILKFLHRVAASDYKVVKMEKSALIRIGTKVGININCTESWLVDEWTADDEKLLNEMLANKSDLSGLTIGWAMEIMNADNIKHQNEQVAILHLIQSSIGNPKYLKATMVPVSKLDDVIIQMVKMTPEICHEKGDWWQKKKKDKPLKRVGASVSYQANGKKKFVTAVNYELSMPGGSRCAEQNAVGMAIAQEPKLRFQDIKDVVVYGGGGLSNPCWPCGVCMENLRKLDAENQISLYVFPSGYRYERGNLPDSMFKLSISDLSQRKGDR